METIVNGLPYVYAGILFLSMITMTIDIGKERKPLDVKDVIVSIIIITPLIVYLITRG